MPSNLVLVIFGASGDLTRKKLLPALAELYAGGQMPERFAVLGVGRTALGDNGFRAGLTAGSGGEGGFARSLRYLAMDPAEPGEYAALAARMAELDLELGSGGNAIFYLATPPSMYGTIADNLAAAGLSRPPDGAQAGAFRRIVVEKPFGMDGASASELDARLHRSFGEDQIYRIDHYLGKETVQNILVTRFSNALFEPAWNRNFVSHVEISSFEDFGVEGRGGYYDGAGALRDMVQNHLLQLVALVAMEPPARMDAWSLRSEMLKVFQALRPIGDVEGSVVRGRYGPGSGGRPGYLDEKGVAPGSRTETFVALKFFVDNWRWSGVPFFIRTGKSMPAKVTEIAIHFRSAPLSLFGGDSRPPGEENVLVIRIQPDEGLLVRFGLKVPGGGFDVRPVDMDFHYSSLKGAKLASAYARLLLDCMNGDQSLYTRDDAIEATWAFVDPVLKAWRENPDIPLYEYAAGSWGPEAADGLVGSLGLSWRHPCRNLADGGEYCAL